jgi:FkbM family methyltransferase
MNRKLSRLVHRAEVAIRGRLVPNWRAHRIEAEQIMGHVLRLLNIDCVFDVGANNGGYALMLRDYCGYKGRIISFEPTPDVVVALKKAAAGDPLWDVHGYALGRTEGALKLQVHHARHGSSFLPVSDDVAHLTGNKIVAQVEVPVKTLNAVFPELQKQYGFKRAFLKMDTQGFDMEVFNGGLDVMPLFYGLQSELSIHPFYKNTPFWLDSLKEYEKAGFVLTSFIPSSSDQPLRLREIDCVMARSN